MVEVLTAILALVIGFVGGVLLHLLRRPQKTSDGSLRVDRSDPDGPYLFLQLAITPEELMQKQSVNLDVVLKDFNSQN